MSQGKLRQYYRRPKMLMSTRGRFSCQESRNTLQIAGIIEISIYYIYCPFYDAIKRLGRCTHSPHRRTFSSVLDSVEQTFGEAHLELY